MQYLLMDTKPDMVSAWQDFFGEESKGRGRK